MHDNMNMMNRPDNHEAKMARADLFKCAQYSFKLFKMISETQELEGWVQAKITKAADYIASVYHYMEYEMKISEYGDAIENADMYSESIRRVFAQKLTEAKKQAVKAKDDMKKKEKALDEERSSTGGEITRSKGVTKHKENPNRYSDEEHTEPKSQAKSKSSAEKAGDKAHDKAQEKDSKAWGKANPGKQTIMKGGVKTTNENTPLTPAQGAALMKSKDPNAYNKMTGQKTPAKLTKAVSDPEGVPAKPVKEGSKPDFLDMDKDGNKKEPMKKAVADKKKNPFAKVKESAKPDFLDMDKDGNKKEPMKKAVADKKVKEAAGKCNHSPKGKSCPVHGLKECGGMYEGDKFNPLKHVKNPTQGEKTAAKDVKRGSYGDRAAMLKSAEADGRLKK
jgi:hypothetical protein